jgi:Flp pilus assembly protein TadG
MRAIAAARSRLARAKPSALAGLRRARRRVTADEGGIAAVEFAMVLPILLVLWIGGVEVTSALSIDRRLNNFGASIGDLVSRSEAVSYSQLEDIFDLAHAALFPYDHAAVKMRVTAVTILANGDTMVAWSRARNMTAYSTDTNVNDWVPESLRAPAAADSQIIMAEVFYTYRPAVGYVVTSDIELEERTYFVPRLSPKVKICPADDQASCVDSI